MRIKLIFFIIVALTPLAGVSMQNSSEDNQITPKNTESNLTQISVSSLSDTEGVNLQGYLAALKKTTQDTWEKSFPSVAETRFPNGVVTIRFKIMPTGQIMNGSMVLEGRSGNAALDRAIWSTLTNSKYAALPNQFHGPYIELRSSFSYNPRPKM